MDELNSVWSLIGAFFDALPPEVVMIVNFTFSGALIVGLLRWLK